MIYSNAKNKVTTCVVEPACAKSYKLCVACSFCIVMIRYFFQVLVRHLFKHYFGGVPEMQIHVLVVSGNILDWKQRRLEASVQPSI